MLALSGLQEIQERLHPMDHKPEARVVYQMKPRVGFPKMPSSKWLAVLYISPTSHSMSNTNLVCGVL